MTAREEAERLRAVVQAGRTMAQFEAALRRANAALAVTPAEMERTLQRLRRQGIRLSPPRR